MVISAVDASFGEVLSSETTLAGNVITGIPSSNEWFFTWTCHVVVLDVQGSMNGTISIVFDGLFPRYLAFDNLVIPTSNMPFLVPDV